MEDSGEPHDGATQTSASKCGDSARLIVDHAAALTDEAGKSVRALVEVPPVVVDDEYLYYLVNFTVGRSRNAHVMRVSLRGGSPERLQTLTGGGTLLSQGLALFAGGLITARAPENPSDAGAILKLSNDGSEMTVIAETAGAARALFVEDASVVFSDAQGTKQVSVDGGPVRQLVDQISLSFSAADSKLYLGGESLLALDTSTETVSVVVAEPALHPLACGDAVCWIGGPSLSGELVELGSSGSRETLAAGLSEVHALVFDGDNFFLTTGGGGLSLLRVPVHGGAAKLVTRKPAVTLAFDDDCLYWAGASGIFSMSRAKADKANADGSTIFF